MAVHDLMLEIDVRSEFEVSEMAPAAAPERPHSCLARLNITEGEIHFEFYNPYWARGLYHIRYDLLDQWKTSSLSSDERRDNARLTVLGDRSNR